MTAVASSVDDLTVTATDSRTNVVLTVIAKSVKSRSERRTVRYDICAQHAATCGFLTDLLARTGSYGQETVVGVLILMSMSIVDSEAELAHPAVAIGDCARVGAGCRFAAPCACDGWTIRIHSTLSGGSTEGRRACMRVEDTVLVEMTGRPLEGGRVRVGQSSASAFLDRRGRLLGTSFDTLGIQPGHHMSFFHFSAPHLEQFSGDLDADWDMVYLGAMERTSPSAPMRTTVLTDRQSSSAFGSVDQKWRVYMREKVLWVDGRAYCVYVAVLEAVNIRRISALCKKVALELVENN